MLKTVLLVATIASVVSAAVGIATIVYFYLTYGKLALRIMERFAPEPTVVPDHQERRFCKQCHQYENHDPGCPSLSYEAMLFFDEGWRDARQSKPVARPENPSYMLARRLYSSSIGLKEARSHMAAVSMQGSN